MKSKRSKAGRKALPAGQKKTGLSIYIPEELIAKLGGKDDVRYAMSMFALMAGGGYPEAAELWRTIMIHRKHFGPLGGFSLELMAANIAAEKGSNQK